MSNTLYLGIGSNLGNRIRNINNCYKLLQQNGQITNSSFLYRSAPMYYLSQPQFINLVLQYKTNMDPFQSLQFFQQIEQQLDRNKLINKGPRTIDIDILYFNNQNIHDHVLTVPHKSISERLFVIRPLLDIDPDLVDFNSQTKFSSLQQQLQQDQQQSCQKVMMVNKRDDHEMLFEIEDYRAYKMGVANISQDSFYHSFDNDSLDKLDQYVSNFDLIDIGAESTRPKSKAIQVEEEIDRLEQIMNQQFVRSKVVSLDSKKYEVCQYYQDKIDIVNDVSGIHQSDQILQFVKNTMKPIVIMHNIDSTANELDQIQNNNTVDDIVQFFDKKLKQCLEMQIPRWNIVFDIGLAFNKTTDQNLELLQNYDRISQGLAGMPSLIGFSNKRLIKDLFKDDKMLGNHVLSAICFQKKINFLRIHDIEVSKTIDILNNHF